MTFGYMPAHISAAACVAAPMSDVLVDGIAITVERPDDAAPREALLDRAFGPARQRKTCQLLRAGRVPARGLSLVARAAAPGSAGCALVGTVRLWHVAVGGVQALMLGPLAVDDDHRCHRLGSRLMNQAIARAAELGHAAILLVGDEPYYRRFGFERRLTQQLHMPGPVEDERFLGLELAPGALAAAQGLVRATGALDLAGDRGRRRLGILAEAA